MFCSACGTKQDQEAKFCAQCGKNLSSARSNIGENKNELISATSSQTKDVNEIVDSAIRADRVIKRFALFNGLRIGFLVGAFICIILAILTGLLFFGLMSEGHSVKEYLNLILLSGSAFLAGLFCFFVGKKRNFHESFENNVVHFDLPKLQTINLLMTYCIVAVISNLLALIFYWSDSNIAGFVVVSAGLAEITYFIKCMLIDNADIRSLSDQLYKMKITDFRINIKFIIQFLFYAAILGDMVETSFNMGAAISPGIIKEAHFMHKFYFAMLFVFALLYFLFRKAKEKITFQ